MSFLKAFNTNFPLPLIELINKVYLPLLSFSDFFGKVQVLLSQAKPRSHVKSSEAGAGWRYEIVLTSNRLALCWRYIYMGEASGSFLGAVSDLRSITVLN